MTILVDQLLPLRPGLSASRQRVFAAAVRLFGQHGYHGVSVRDLADDLGVKAPALYAHVPSKQDLLYQLVVIGHEEHRDRLRAALLDAGADPVDQVRAMIRAHVLVHLEFPALARVSHREIGALDETQLATVQAILDESRRTFLDVVERGRTRDAFHVEHPALAMNAITSMGVRAAEWWTAGTYPEAEVVADTFAEYAIRILS